MHYSLTISGDTEEEGQELATVLAAITGVVPADLQGSVEDAPAAAAAVEGTPPGTAGWVQPSAAAPVAVAPVAAPSITASPEDRKPGPEPTLVDGAILRDSAGTPFCDAIHQKTKGQLADGTWKYKKGQNRDGAKVIAENLRLNHPTPVAAAPVAVAPVAAAPVAVAPVAAAMGAAPTAPPAGATALPVPVAAAPVAGVLDVATVQAKVSEAHHAGVLPIEDITTLYNKVGVTSPLAANPAQLLQLYNEATAALAGVPISA
ncbi:MAG: hypothetical protein JKY94_17725 [Rhodobacteraceae bacterium]|nr:hypothetical protein [Paracoccaceae bacterium]